MSGNVNTCTCTCIYIRLVNMIVNIMIQCGVKVVQSFTFV